MSNKVGAKTKGWIKNNVTGETKSFQFNPTTFSYSRGANYSEISAPGMSYPNTQYVSGAGRTFPIDLLLIDKPHSGLIDGYIAFFEKFLPAEKNVAFTKPDDLTFCYGTFIRKCVLISMSVDILEMDSKGKAVTVSIKLDFRQVSV